MVCFVYLEIKNTRSKINKINAAKEEDVEVNEVENDENF